MKFCILTLGCKVNAYESEFIKEKFLDIGWIETKLDDNPDVIVVNTCSVTNQSDAKSRHMIRNARKSSANAVIVACGCSAQNHRDAMLEYGANIVIGTKDKSRIADYIDEYLNSQENITKFYDMQDEEFEHMFIKSEEDKTRAFVKIQDGCNNFCSYCIIPYMRGNIRSKDIEVAESEINTLVKAGHKEIVLTGIHTGSYGRGKDFDLVDLIRRVSVNPNLERIRISSIEITELDDKFLDELKNNPKICNHLHIPLQSGSDLVLSKMNRKYDTDYFYDKISKIRSIRPDISITTDLIVGFAYETEEEFRKTKDFIKKVEFTKIHTFPFSLRSGTKAEEMSEHFVKDSDKKCRVGEILELSAKLESNYYKKFIGKTMKVIIESSKGEEAQGHTDNYILVHIDQKLSAGSIVSVMIDSVDNIHVKGYVVDVD